MQGEEGTEAGGSWGTKTLHINIQCLEFILESQEAVKGRRVALSE